MTEAAIFDIDGTIASAEWRNELARRKAWDAFHRGIPFDASIPSALAELDKHASEDRRIILVTARTDRWRADTMGWLDNHDVPWHDLHMRKTNDVRRLGSEIKREIYETLILGRYDVVAVYEDHPKIVPMWAEVLGIEVPCLQDPGIEPHDPEKAYAWLQEELAALDPQVNV